MFDVKIFLINGDGARGKREKCTIISESTNSGRKGRMYGTCWRINSIILVMDHEVGDELFHQLKRQFPETTSTQATQSIKGRRVLFGSL
jgi:hypothetical protein